MKGIVIVAQPKCQVLWNNIIKLTRPGWGFINLSDNKQAPKVPKEHSPYVSAVIYNSMEIESRVETESTFMSGVSLDPNDSKSNDVLKKLQDKVQLVYIPMRVKRSENTAEINAGLSLGEFAQVTELLTQTVGIIPIFAFHFVQQMILVSAQETYSEFATMLHKKRIFPEGCIVETTIIDIQDKQKALMNLAILRRTIPSIINSIVLRFDSKTQKKKDVFHMTFVSIKLPWLFAFSFCQLTSLEEVERAAFECTAIQ